MKGIALLLFAAAPLYAQQASVRVQVIDRAQADGEVELLQRAARVFAMSLP